MTQAQTTSQFNPPAPAEDATVPQVMDWVNRQTDTAAAAQFAYDRERERETPRTTLLDQLYDLGAVNPEQQTSGETSAAAGTGDTGAQSPEAVARTMGAFPNGPLPGDDQRTQTVTSTMGAPGNTPDGGEYDIYAHWNEETHGPKPGPRR